MQLIPRRILFFLIIILGLAWLFITRSFSITTPGFTIAPYVGFSTPPISLKTMTGETIELDDFPETLIILNFWASWCPPCRAEMPALQAVYDEYQGTVEILAINASNQDSLDSVRRMQDEFGLTFPILMDSSGIAQIEYAINSLPTTYFIGYDGIIKKVEIGGPLTEASLRVWIEQMLKEKP